MYPSTVDHLVGISIMITQEVRILAGLLAGLLTKTRLHQAQTIDPISLPELEVSTLIVLSRGSAFQIKFGIGRLSVTLLPQRNSKATRKSVETYLIVALTAMPRTSDGSFSCSDESLPCRQTYQIVNDSSRHYYILHGAQQWLSISSIPFIQHHIVI